MRAEERAERMVEAARASQTELRSILRLEQIAIKGSWDPSLLTPAELKELCSLVLRHLTWDPNRSAAPKRAAQKRSDGDRTAEGRAGPAS